jgi:DNA primase
MRHEDIVARVDILKLLEKLGLEGKVQGKEFMCRCPFPEHPERTPSFSIAVEGKSVGKFQCFGCGAKGNSLHLVQRVLGVEREAASRQIAQWFDFPDALNFPTNEELSRLLDKPIEVEEEEEDLIRIPLPKVSDDKELILNYLCGRRRYSLREAMDIVNLFDMAYSDSGYYHHRLIIPIFDAEQNLVTFEARDITGKAEKKALYPKGSPMSKVLFNFRKRGRNEVWITEGIWDALRLWSFGENAIATFGAHLTVHQARMIINRYSKVVLLYDGDKAGKNAAHGVPASGRQEAIKGAFEILSPYVETIVYDLQFGDPDELLESEFNEIRRQLNYGGRNG